MTLLEKILIIIIWFSYAFHATYNKATNRVDPTIIILFCFCAPIVFTYRAIYGAFIHSFRLPFDDNDQKK
jgi:hypothetical protein